MRQTGTCLISCGSTVRTDYWASFMIKNSAQNENQLVCAWSCSYRVKSASRIAHHGDQLEIALVAIAVSATDHDDHLEQSTECLPAAVWAKNGLKRVPDCLHSIEDVNEDVHCNFGNCKRPLSKPKSTLGKHSATASIHAYSTLSPKCCTVPHNQLANSCACGSGMIWRM